MSVSIRRAHTDDAAAICAIGRVSVEQAHRDSCSAEDMELFLNANYTPEALQAELEDDNNIYFLLLKDGKAVGFVKIIPDAQHLNIALARSAKLDRIYLLPEYYGHRLGHELLQHAAAFARENGQEAMWLFTWTGNERAIRFYNKEGFKIIGSHKFKVSETHYNPHHQMMWRF